VRRHCFRSFRTGYGGLGLRPGSPLLGTDSRVLSAAIFATLPWAVLYGRMGLAEADSAFFVLLAVRIQVGDFLPTSRSGLGCGGRGGGARRSSVLSPRLLSSATIGGECCSPSSSPDRGRESLLGSAWFRAQGYETVSGLCRSACPAARIRLAAALPLLLMDAAYGQLVLGPLLDRPVRPRTYLEDLGRNFGKFEAMGIGLRDPLRLPLFLWSFGGPVLLAGLLAALSAPWLRRTRDTGLAEDEGIQSRLGHAVVTLAARCRSCCFSSPLRLPPLPVRRAGPMVPGGRMGAREPAEAGGRPEGIAGWRSALSLRVPSVGFAREPDRGGAGPASDGGTASRRSLDLEPAFRVCLRRRVAPFPWYLALRLDPVLRHAGPWARRHRVSGLDPGAVRPGQRGYRYALWITRSGSAGTPPPSGRFARD